MPILGFRRWQVNEVRHLKAWLRRCCGGNAGTNPLRLPSPRPPLAAHGQRPWMSYSCATPENDAMLGALGGTRKLATSIANIPLLYV
jgi:hypothetical protein